MEKELDKLLQSKEFEEFFALLPKIAQKLNDKQRQELLVEIIDFHYDRKHFSNFKKAFDLIIGSKLNLNFNIDHWAPTFLSLIILRSPSIELFEYFVEKGADINFVGDSLAFEEGDSLKFEKKHLLFGQYQTCLDFAQIKLNDLLTVDYNYGTPDRKTEEDWRNLTDNEGEITISKREYLYLCEQSEYLFDLISTDKLIDHIVNCAGKKYKEIEQNTTGNTQYKKLGR